MGRQHLLKDSANIFMTWRIREKAKKSYDDIKLDAKASLNFRTYPAPWKLETCLLWHQRLLISRVGEKSLLRWQKNKWYGDLTPYKYFLSIWWRKEFGYYCEKVSCMHACVCVHAHVPVCLPIFFTSRINSTFKNCFFFLAGEGFLVIVLLFFSFGLQP